MECLTKLVGLDGCESSTAPFTLNQIGYSKSQLEEMMDDSYSTVDQFLEANKKTAAQVLVSDFFGMVSDGSFSKQVINSGIAGMYPSESVLDSVSGIRGASIKVNGQSEFWKINISYVTLYTDYDGDVDLNLYDLTTGDIIHTKTITLEANKIIRVDFDYSYESNLSQANLFLGYDTTGINPYKAQVSVGACCGRKPTCSFSSGSIVGGEIVSPFHYGSVSKKDTTAGLTIQYSIECNNAAFLCSIRSMLGLAMLYRTAMAILDFSMGSGGQFSNQKTINEGGNEDRWTRAEYQYNKELQKLKNQVTLPENVCFGCGKRVRFKSTLPA